jgi:hypothetical protein
MDDVKYSSKVFLGTDPSEAGAICAVIYRKTYEKYDSFSASIRLQDCSKHIVLDFCINDAAERLERIDKVENLIIELEAFRDHFIKESAEHLEAVAKREEDEKGDD